jgi:GT2 family glycosyltransferase
LRAELDGMLDLPAVGRFALALDSLLRQDGEHRRLADEHSRAHEQVATQASELVGLRASLAELQSELAAERARMEEAEKRIGEAAHVRAELERQIEARSNEALHHLAHVGELERAREAALIEAAALARRMGEAQERAGFEAGRVATLERELGRRRGFWRRSGVAEGSRDESDASGLSLQRASFRALRALYRRLPLDERGRARAKSLFYRSFGRIYRDQQNYQLWKALDRQPAGEAPASSAPPVASAEHSAAPAPLRLTRSVSIVIPAYGKADMTRRCIESVQRADGGAACEIVVVDDASPEPLALQLAGLTHVTIVRNETNQGFIGACNRGAEVAGGSLLLFLNNDTEVRRDVITAMADTFDREPDTGLVGCKLVFPDGRLQEAGCSIDHAGNAVMIGLWDDPSRPRYNFEREVAYCSGACFMIERELFVRLGGFDPAFAPAYCEDSDLCFRVRAAGRRVVYQPRAEVVHALSASMQDSPIDKMAVIAVNQRRFLERWAGALAAEDKVRAIALYLPQYHAIAENDRWWGEGFTEWTNVARAQPSFEGHAQPNVPASIGYYDLRLPAVRSEQARLAREAGLSGFCYYYYWFGGTRLLHEPLDAVIASGEPDFPFCVCWANENWTRRWDGLDSEILIAQQHSAEDDLAFIDSLLPALRDPRYIRVHGKPLLLVYRPALLPDAAATARRWRERVREAGLPGLYLVSVQSFFHVDSRGPNAFGFDAAAEFPPHSFAVRCPEQPRGFPGKRFEGTAYDYAKTAESFLTREMPAYKVFRGVMPRWDNTARRGVHANVFLGASPEGYRQWLQRAVDYTRQMYFGDERLVFVNAWNEWGEGNYLEPDERHGTAYLEATKSVLAAVNEART